MGFGAYVGSRMRDAASPLHWVAYVGLPKVVELLLEKDSDVDVGTEDQLTALHIAEV